MTPICVPDTGVQGLGEDAGVETPSKHKKTSNNTEKHTQSPPKTHHISLSTLESTSVPSAFVELTGYLW